MATYTNDILFIQALDNYPYDIEQCIEKLQYVLGGEDHAGANYLMGRIYSEQLEDVKSAKEYYHKALCIDYHYIPTYYYYSLLLIDISDYSEAEKVINVGFTLPQIDEARLLYIKSIMYEKQENFKEALSCLKEAKIIALNNGFRSDMNDHIDRIKAKKKELKKSKKTNKKKLKSNRVFRSLLD